MLYDFKCTACDHIQAEVFPANDYDKYVMEDGRLKRKKCEECRTMKLYRHIIEAPSVLGGTKGYVSMERWQQQNPEHAKKQEDKVVEKMEDRHRKKVLDRINKQNGGGKREDRHEGYGQGKGEEKLKSDD